MARQTCIENVKGFSVNLVGTTHFGLPRPFEWFAEIRLEVS